MRIYERFKNWLTLQKATRIYLWFVVIRWILRWTATAIFIAWVWCAASDTKKDELTDKFRFWGKHTEKKTETVKIEWCDKQKELSINGTPKQVYFGLGEDGKIYWK